MIRLMALLLLFISLESYSIELIAHRANCCGIKENSLLAITESWESGADAIEVDLRVSSDGIIYLFHDETLNGADVSTYTYAEVFEVDNDVIALSSVLGLGVPNGYYVLDLKQDDNNFLSILKDEILDSDFPVEKIAFQSANIEALRVVRKAFPSATYIWLSKLRRSLPWFSPPSPLKLAEVLRRNQLDHISIKGRKFIDIEFINKLKTKGISIFVWTINDPERAMYYADIGVDGIITDNLLGVRAANKVLKRASR